MTEAGSGAHGEDRAAGVGPPEGAGAPVERAPASSDADPVSGPSSLGATEAERARLDPWGQLTRAGATLALLGASVVAWAQFTFESRWVTRFVVHNDLEMPARMMLIASYLGGAVAAVLLGGAVFLVSRRWGHRAADLERLTQFLLPLALLPAIPLLFRYKPWDERTIVLLPTCAVAVVLLERACIVSLRSIPARVGRAAAWLASRRPALLAHVPAALVGAGVVGYVAFFAYHGVAWHRSLQTHSAELGVLNNLLFGALKGSAFHSPVLFGPDGPSHLAAHFELGVHLLLPLYAVAPRAETLIVAQSALAGLSAVPLYAFARRRSSSPWASAAIALAYLANPSLHSATFYEASSLVLAAPFVIGGVWALEARRWWVAAASLLVAASMRQDVALCLSVVGLVYAASGHRPRFGLVVAFGALTYFFVVRMYVMPRMGGGAEGAGYQELWAPGEKGIGSVLRTLTTNPLFVITRQVDVESVGYLLQILLPVAFLPLRRSAFWLAFLPALALTVLASHSAGSRAPTFPAVMHWVPYLFLAAVVVLEKMARDPIDGVPRRRAALIALVFATAVTSFNLGAFSTRPTFTSGHARVHFEHSREEADQYADLVSVVDRIPAEASVAATETLGPHVSSRRELYSLRRGAQGAEYLLARRTDLDVERTKPELASALGRGEYGVLARQGEFALLRKGHQGTETAALRREWGLE